MFRKSRGNRENRETVSVNRMMFRRILFLMIVCGIVAFVLLGYRLFQLQILEHDQLETAAMDQQVRQTAVTAHRGTIYDRNMNILAMSDAVSNIYISPAEIQMNEENPIYIAQGLANILGVDYQEIYEYTQNTDSWYTVLARKVDDDITDQVRLFKENAGRDAQGNPVEDEKDSVSLTGVKIEEASRRYYPYSTLASHVVGFTGADDHGLAGLEFYYDDVLAGKDGRIVRAANGIGNDMMFTDLEDYYDAQDGQSIVTTLDTTIQYYLEKNLQSAVEDYNLQDGAAGIVMDVNTGAVLGMASLGEFDPNNYAVLSEEAEARLEKNKAGLTTEEYEDLVVQERAEMWRNKAVSYTYEPGSVFKMVTLASGLESGAIDTSSVFYCGGSISVLGRTDPLNCANIYGHGDQTLEEAVMHSCNVAFTLIGQYIGAERFYDYIEAFGLFGHTGIDMTGEADSLWWSEDVFFDRNNLSQLAAASFGQTFTITPLQMITAACAVANGGYLMKPYVVSEILNADGSVAKQTEPTMVRQVISEKTSRICCEILEQVVGNVEEGTGTNAYVPGYRVAGKTGTSEDVLYEATYGDKKYICSFLGFAPADDPEVAVLVLLENPSQVDQKYSISGGVMAAPKVGMILQDILPYLGVEPSYKEGEEGIVDQRLPNMVGKNLEEAQATLTEAGFTVKSIEGEGTVVTAQIPSGNVKIAAGSEIVLYCGEAPSPEPVEVPDLLGLSYDIAKTRAGWQNLYVRGEGTMLNSPIIMTVDQSIPAGTLVEPGTIITLTLSDSSKLTIW